MALNTFRLTAGDGKGYRTAGDVLVNRLADGVSLDSVWNEINEANTLYNEHRSALASLLCFRTTAAGDSVPQAGWGNESFEEATEFGVPRGIGTAEYLKLGYSFKDYDLASRFTWKFLRNATSEQITHATQRIFEADNKLVNGSILQRLFSNVPTTNDFGHTCYPLWNGDNIIPPAHMGQTFGTTNHYLANGADVLDAEDVEQAVKLIRRFGYGTTQNARFLLLINPTDFEASGMTAWKAGVDYAQGKTAKYDFIPSSNAPAYFSAEQLHGATPPVEYGGLAVTGSYAGALVIESYFVPVGYAAVVASGGPNSESNPIGLREHTNPAYQGLRVIPGHWQDYPLIEMFYARGFGTGVRHRGAAVAIQITTDTDYTVPVIPV